MKEKRKKKSYVKCKEPSCFEKWAETKEKSKKYLKTKNLCVKNGLTCLNCGQPNSTFICQKKKKPKTKTKTKLP